MFSCMAQFIAFSTWSHFLTSANFIISLYPRLSWSPRLPSHFRLLDFVAQINFWPLVLGCHWSESTSICLTKSTSYVCQ